MSEHTPTPWIVLGVRHQGTLKPEDNTPMYMIGPDGDAVAAVFFDRQTGLGFSDAHFIVTAVNRHDDLVAALEYLSDESRYDVTVTRIAKAALLSATGKST